MDNSPNPVANSSELSSLRAQCDNLQQLVSSLLLILIVISGTLSIFLLRQWRFIKAELDTVRPAAIQLVTDYTNNYAFTQDFIRKVAEYGRTHPDFSPIVLKYRLNDFLVKPGAAPVTSSLPTSASPSSKKE